MGSHIRRFGAPCLRQHALPVAAAAPETKAILDQMWEVLAADGGVGLAAPQIAENVRLVVVRDPERPRAQQRLDFVNPVIKRTYGPEKYFNEGCLSFPGLYTQVLRREGVELSFERPGVAGVETLRYNGLLARIIQHEVDHLDGVLFIDHLSFGERLILGPKLLQIMASRVFARHR